MRRHLRIHFILHRLWFYWIITRRLSLLCRYKIRWWWYCTTLLIFSSIWANSATIIRLLPFRFLYIFILIQLSYRLRWYCSFSQLLYAWHNTYTRHCSLRNFRYFFHISFQARPPPAWYTQFLFTSHRCHSHASYLHIELRTFQNFF